MRGSRFVTIEDFSKGLNVNGTLYNTPFDMAYVTRDVEPLGRFGLRRREATKTWSTGYGAAIDFALFSRSQELVFVGATGKIYSTPPATGTPTQIGADIANFNPPIFAVEAPTVGGQGPIYWAANTGSGDTSASAYWQSTSAARAAWTTPPAGRVRAMTYYGNRVWIAIGTSLYFSDIGDPTSWPAGNVVQLDPWASGTLGSAGSITALVPCGAVLLAFKRDKVWVIYDLDTGANRTLAGVGCIGPRACVQSAEGEVYFMGPKGTYRTNGSSVQTIASLIRSNTDAPSAEPVLTFVGGRYLFVSFTEALDSYVYDVEFKSWWNHRLAITSSPVASGVGFAMPHPAPPYNSAIDINSILYVPRSSGKSNQLSMWRPNHSGDYNGSTATDTEGGSTPSFIWTGGLIELEKEMTTLKRLRECNVIGAGTDTITVMGRNVAFPTGGVSADHRRVRLASLGVDNEWNLRIDGSGGSDANQRILSVTLAFIPRKN